MFKFDLQLFGGSGSSLGKARKQKSQNNVKLVEKPKRSNRRKTKRERENESMDSLF